MRRSRITAKDRSEAFSDLADMGILTDSQTGNHIWSDTLELADRHRLTVYDATYLELALRLALPLATLDDELREAALREGVAVMGK